MKKISFLISFFLIFLIPLSAGTVYYVKPTGNNNNTGLGLSDALAWQTIARATAAAGPGDIVNIMAGTYTAGDSSACLRTHVDGTLGNPITFQNYGNDIVILKNQYYGISIQNNYITISGLRVMNDAQTLGSLVWGVKAGSNNHIILQNCVIRNCSPGDGGVSWGIDWEWVTYGKILDCQIDHVGTPASAGLESGNGIGMAGTNNLIEGCTIDYCGHAGLFLACDKSVIRNCTLIGTWGIPGEFLHYGTEAKRLVIENCILRSASGLEDGAWSNQSFQPQGSNIIFRRNRIYNGIGAGLGSYSNGSYHNKHNKYYHNVIYRCGNMPESPYIRGPYEFKEEADGTTADIIIKNSVHYTNGQDAVTYSGYANPADVTFDGCTWNSTNPLFVNAPADLSVQDGSPCIDRGVFLTKSKYAGSGNQIEVEDAGYFVDGFGLIPGDVVQFQGQAQTARITAINYASNSLTFDQPLTWNAGQAVSLPYSGAAPDIGVFEFEGGDPQGPVASFNASPSEGSAPLEVYLDASSSYDPDGSIASYSWDFGDGTAGSGVMVTHAYQNYGAFAATLTVTDNNNQTSSATTNITVNGPPSAVFSTAPNSGRLPIKVKFDASSSSDPAGRIVSYTWDFGDGKLATGKVVSHHYAQEGVYTATLTVKDDMGLTGSASQDVTIAASPVPGIMGGPKKGRAPNTTNFDASASKSSQQGTNITSYEWNFGDGIQASGKKVRHVYSSIGKYLLTLTVTDEKNKMKSTTVEVCVYSVPKALFICSPAEGIKTSTPVTFDAAASYDDYDEIVSYDWKFGDGTTGNGKTVTHAYSKGGRYYSISLTVTNAQGYKKFASRSLFIKKN
jgi:PKD repeat protein